MAREMLIIKYENITIYRVNHHKSFINTALSSFTPYLYIRKEIHKIAQKTMQSTINYAKGGVNAV